MVAKALFSSDCEEWGTPLDLFQQVKDAYHFGFNLDAAASAENTLCPIFYSKEDDGLSKPWCTWTWCNPPYGRNIIHWVRKAGEEWNNRSVRARSVMLLPARTDTEWFHLALRYGAVPVFLKGRLKFRGAKNSAPFPSMLFIFGVTQSHSFFTFDQQRGR